MARWKREQRRRVRVDPDARAIDNCRAVARQFAPDTTDEELVQGLRELADAIERDAEARKHRHLGMVGVGG